MAVFKTTEIKLDHVFDGKECRHYTNGHVSVLHCHHYATLYSQLADDCGMLDGKKLLAEVAEDIFMEVLKSYYEDHGITDLRERIAIGEQYFAASGLGMLEVICLGDESGAVEMTRSHVDQGWVKKWGTREKPVNFIGCGYIAGMFAAVLDKPARSFRVEELQSLVSGAECSKFNVVAN